MLHVSCSMMILVGLGNPGVKYQNNRHNVGFMFIDFMVKKLESLKVRKLKEEKMLHVTCYRLHDLILAKPQTFMNNSGLAVKSCVTRYTLHVTQNLFIVHDDLDIPLGNFKIQKGVGPKLHNGIESIEKALGRKDFWRIRIGVDNRPPKNQPSHLRYDRGKDETNNKRTYGEIYVLQDFKPSEKEIINETFPKILQQLKNTRLI